VDRIYFSRLKVWGRIEKRPLGFVPIDAEGQKMMMKQGSNGTGANAYFFILGSDLQIFVNSPKEHGLIKRLSLGDLATEARSWD
jgi:hypothetical protein